MRPWHLVRTFKKGYEADRDGVEVQLEIYDEAKTHMKAMQFKASGLFKIAVTSAELESAEQK
jgi:hypothetical protein